MLVGHVLECGTLAELRRQIWKILRGPGPGFQCRYRVSVARRGSPAGGVLYLAGEGREAYPQKASMEMPGPISREHQYTSSEATDLTDEERRQEVWLNT